MRVSIVLLLAVGLACGGAFGASMTYTSDSDPVQLSQEGGDPAQELIQYSGDTITFLDTTGIVPETATVLLIDDSSESIMMDATDDFTWTCTFEPDFEPVASGSEAGVTFNLRLYFGGGGDPIAPNDGQKLRIRLLEGAGGSFNLNGGSGTESVAFTPPLNALRVSRVGNTLITEYNMGDGGTFTTLQEFDLTGILGSALDWSEDTPVWPHINWGGEDFPVAEMTITWGPGVEGEGEGVSEGEGEGVSEGEGEVPPPTYDVEFSPDMFDEARSATQFVSTSDDFNANGIPDIDEMGLLAAIMMNNLYPHSQPATEIFLANAEQFFSEIVALGLVDALGGEAGSRYFSTGVSGLVTLGILPASAIGLGSDDANYDVSIADDIMIDYNQDGITNAEEWVMFEGDRQAWIDNMLPTLPVASVVGMSVLGVGLALLGWRRRSS